VPSPREVALNARKPDVGAKAEILPSRPESGREPLAAALVAAGLRKVFRHPWTLKTKVAVEGLSLTVERGEIFGLLGPNGAGKTTTLKMLLGLLKPTAGNAWLLGTPIGSPESRRRVGYLPENPYFFDRLTAREFLIFSAQLAGIARGDAVARAERWLERLGLGARARTPLRKYSKGMVQRVGLAHALLHDPELVFLDEPMSGLDPLGRREFRDLILECKDRGTTVVFSSHILPDVELICDRVAVLSQGRIARSGPLDDLLSGEEDGAEIVVAGPLPLLLPPRFAGVAHGAHGQRVRLEVPRTELVDPLVAHLLSKEYRLISVTPRRRSLESVVLEVAGHDDAPPQRSRRRAG
jgi:ABC-2 type transport system ATP-binding protein